VSIISVTYKRNDVLRRQGSEVRPVAVATGDGAAAAAEPEGSIQPLGCIDQSCRARRITRYTLFGANVLELGSTKPKA
jgi:hypothetical protein